MEPRNPYRLSQPVQPTSKSDKEIKIMEPFIIMALYIPNSRGEIKVSLSVEGDAPISEDISDMVRRYMTRVRAVSSPVSEHLDIMLGMIREAGYKPDMSKQVTCDGVITGWMIQFYCA